MDSFEEIYREYANDVYRFALSLCLDESLAEEITQETFCKALQEIPRFRGQCSLKTWLFQIARNSYLTHCRKQAKQVGLDSRPEPDDGTDLEAQLADHEAAFALHRLLHDLPEPYKEVFSLRLFGELSFSQIAELFGKSESWARVTFYRAKQKLKEALP
jgi:RNA polymerase sigma-70 factor (ECF subfamily)